ncbi:hypothetical protein F7725_010525 [Dissostichus mawsoni]|uniref:Uncharacterized protein n=1 Tax=Dissostichus mawsoni TaxID=36200 RepID=A0A7J5XQ89_DISMA|nr:hypothetical protein F7725_010525 [Dissostichus mawsoni]
MPSKHPEDDVLLQRANKQITDLKEDIRRLSDELKEKDSLVSSLMEVASVQSFLNGVTSPPRLGLRNRFTALSDNPVHPVYAPAALTRPDDPARPAGAPAALARPDDLARPADAPVAPTRPDLHPAASATSAPAADSICAASQATVEATRRPSSRPATTSSRRRLLKEAVLRHSGSFSGPEPARKSSPSPAVSARSPHPQTPANIIRNIRFFNVATRSHTLPPWSHRPGPVRQRLFWTVHPE